MDNAAAEDPICWICHGEGPDGTGKPLIHGGCSCRGSLGHCHSSCLVAFAKVQTKDAVARTGKINIDKIWLSCIHCHRPWSWSMAAIMKKECREFPVNRRYFAQRIIAINFLYESNQLQEAKDLLLDLRAFRVHGQNHVYTKYIENMVELVESLAKNKRLNIELDRVATALERNELDRNKVEARNRLLRLVIVVGKISTAYIVLTLTLSHIIQSFVFTLGQAIVLATLLVAMIFLDWIAKADSGRGARILDFLLPYL